jgi:hypothetical protein
MERRGMMNDEFRTKLRVKMIEYQDGEKEREA